MKTLAHGLELEIPLLKKDDSLYNAENTLKKLEQKWQAQGYNPTSRANEHLLIDVSRVDTQNNQQENKINNPTIVAGYDCVSSIMELAIGPYASLKDLHRATAQSYNEIIDIAESDEAVLFNFSELPNQEVSKENYNKQALEKTFYYYMRDVRGYSHYIGVDGKTQLSPSTGVENKNTIEALNLITRLSPVFIALYANSPFEEGKDTQIAENRLSLWEREFQTSIFPQDKYLYINPEKFFTSWKHYIAWMYNRDIPFFALCTDKNRGFKVNHDLCYVLDAPDLITFFRKDSWLAKDVITHKEVTIQPDIKDLIDQQFLLFTEARARFNFDPTQTTIKEFLHAFDKGEDYFESYFNDLLSYSYVENRVPGSCSPDRHLKNILEKSEIDKNEQVEILSSVHIALSALQKGILENAEEIESYLASINYDNYYHIYKKQAIKKALQQDEKDVNLKGLVESILKIVQKNSSLEERKYLKFIEYTVNTGLCCADRARHLILENTHNSTDWHNILFLRNAIKYEDIQ